ncbi:polypyrimidine tract-binding protein homolog 3 [Tanacetum coccineum]|uniref:Polypyrimidine tract-binding protein homolog 3 n=1 Tax=Tanacetum coccineum TaxID=301880 RepID=A0ABQ5A9W5_9ASTR
MIHHMLYPITVKVMHQVFFSHWYVEKVAIFQKSAGVQTLIQFQSCQNAIAARNLLQGPNNTKPPFSADTFSNNAGDDSENSDPVTPAEQVVDSGHSFTLFSLVEHESPRVLQLWERIGISDVHGFKDNEGSHNFVQPDTRERMRLQTMVMGRPY